VGHPEFWEKSDITLSFPWSWSSFAPLSSRGRPPKKSRAKSRAFPLRLLPRPSSGGCCPLRPPRSPRPIPASPAPPASRGCPDLPTAGLPPAVQLRASHTVSNSRRCASAPPASRGCTGEQQQAGSTAASQQQFSKS
jgi:hypothetical protein